MIKYVKERTKLKGILNSFCRISATLTLCLGVCAAFAEQTPNPKEKLEIGSTIKLLLK